VKTGLPRVRTRVTSITTTSLLSLAGMIFFYLLGRRFHSSSNYARDEIIIPSRWDDPLCSCTTVHIENTGDGEWTRVHEPACELSKKVSFREYATPDGPYFEAESFDESKRDPMQGFRGYMS
jgi:hypothetical protein